MANYTFPNLNYGAGAGATSPLTPQQTNVPSLASLTAAINAMNVSGQQAANVSRIPGAAGLEEQSTANISSQLRGEIPQDVVNMLSQKAAERGVSIGSPGSPNVRAAYLRSLGLTSLDLTGRGQQELSAAYARNPAAPLFDPTSQLLTPYQAGTLGISQQELALRAQEEAARQSLAERQFELTEREYWDKLQEARKKLGQTDYAAFTAAPMYQSTPGSFAPMTGKQIIEPYAMQYFQPYSSRTRYA